MKITGIIAEYNPFHNGHAYQIAKIKEETDSDYVIVAMSGDFVQRGEPAITDKYERARMALSCGADLVLELPALFACASAEYFARAGVALFTRMGCVDYLCFGAENADITQLNKIADYWNQRTFGYSFDNQEELLKDQEKWIDLINRYLKINKGMKVLDLGCGPGFFSVLLANLGCQVIGIDYSDKMLEEARNNARKFKANVEFQKMDVQDLAFQDEIFDLIIGKKWDIIINMQQSKGNLLFGLS